MPSLLIVFEYDTLNGGENSLLAVLPLVQESGWQVIAVWPGHPEAAPSSDSPATLGRSLKDLNVESIALPTHDADGYRLSQQQYRDAFGEILSAKRPDAILCNSLSTSRLCGPVAATAGIPAAGYLRDIIKLSKKAITDINQLDRIIAVSAATKAFHVTQGMEEDKIRVIHNGVDLEMFHPRLRGTEQTLKLRQSLGIDAQSKVGLFVGQIGMRKAVDVLLESFKRLIVAVPDSHLLILGERHSKKQEAVEYEEALITASQQPTIAGRVHWLGRRDDVPQLMAVSDLLLHPARQEPLGRVILESVASGLPVITTLVGGSPEILGCVKSADLLCQVDDADALAARAGTLLQDEQLWSAVSEELRTMACRRFDRQQSFQNLMWSLNELVGRNT